MAVDRTTMINGDLGHISVLGPAWFMAIGRRPGVHDTRTKPSVKIYGLHSRTPSYDHQPERSCTHPHFAFAPSMIGVVWTSLSDLTIFSVVALYFVKCADSRCDLCASASR